MSLLEDKALVTSITVSVSAKTHGAEAYSSDTDFVGWTIEPKQNIHWSVGESEVLALELGRRLSTILLCNLYSKGKISTEELKERLTGQAEGYKKVIEIRTKKLESSEYH